MNKNIAIFASGRGTNAINIINQFKKSEDIHVKLVICNKQQADVVKAAKKLRVEVIVINNEQVNDSKFLIDTLNWYNINLITLAGFLRKLPEEFVNYFSNQILNIHPSLLPKYGGQYMYGDNVHKKVLENSEKESGITIHFVSNEYDKGEIIAQFKCDIEEDETLESLKEKINKLEMIYYPYVIETILI